jgi:hypothetical protein
MVRHLCAELLDRVDYLVTLARLTVLDWLAGPLPETPNDRVIREEGDSRHGAIRSMAPKPSLRRPDFKT